LFELNNLAAPNDRDCLPFIRFFDRVIMVVVKNKAQKLLGCTIINICERLIPRAFANAIAMPPAAMISGSLDALMV